MSSKRHSNRSIRSPSKRCSSDGRELALIDLREELIFSRSHLLWARSVPLCRLELRFARLVPRRDTRIVLCDDGDGLVERAAKILAAAGYTDISLSARRHRRLGEGRPRAVLRRQRAEQGVRRAHRARLPYAERLGRGARRPDAQRHRHGRGRQPAVRRIPARLDPERHQCPGRRACAAHPRHRALAGYAGRRQLRRPHPQHHRRAIADQRRPAEQGRGAAQRHDGLDAGGPDARQRQDPALHRAVQRRPRLCQIGGRAGRQAVRRHAHRCQGAGELPRRHDAHALCVRRARPDRLRRRPFSRRGQRARRPARPGHRPICRHARRADRADRRPRGPRGDDGVLAQADGLARCVRARRKRQREGPAAGAGAWRSAARRTAPSRPRNCPSWWRRTASP